jgi:DNA-binding NarL/FixJ family response regulator
VIEAEVVPWAPGVPEPDVCRDLIAELSPGERQVLELMAMGYAMKQVAVVRGSRLKTVSNQVGIALAKLGVSGHLQALAVLRRAELAA